MPAPDSSAVITRAPRPPGKHYDSLNDVVRIKRDGDRLVVWSAVDEIDDVTRLDIPGIQGDVTLQSIGLANVPAPGDNTSPQPRNFTFKIDVATTQPAVESITMVAYGAGHTTISRDAGPDDAIVSVQLIQAPPAAEPNPGDPNVRLYIRRGAETVLEAGALSFAQLYAEQGREIDRYLRPILRDLNAEASVFAPDPRGAWQVLAERYEPDASLRAKIDAVLERLDAEDFQIRENAAIELQSLGQPAALTLMHVDRSKMSAEKQNNIDSFLASYQPWSKDDANRLRNDPSYLIDCLGMDDASLRALAWKRLKEISQPTADFDPNGDAKARTKSIGAIRDELWRTTRP